MIKVGSKVACRLYNTPEGKFYGPVFEATVLTVLSKDAREITRRRYEVDQEWGLSRWLHRKEILHEIK